MVHCFYPLLYDDGSWVVLAELLNIVHEFVYDGRFSTGGLGPPNPMINEKVRPNIKPVSAP